MNYNYGKFIGQAIESCVDQSFKILNHKIDDGSTDNSKDIIQLYARKYPFKTRFNKNQGLIKSVTTHLKWLKVNIF